MIGHLTLRPHPAAVQRWRRPAARYWRALHPPEAPFAVDYMLLLMWHESRGQASAVNLTSYPDTPGQQAAGLMQHKPEFWAYRIRETVAALRAAGIVEGWMAAAGLEDPYPPPGLPVGILHPKANLAAAVWLWGEQGWQAWTPSAWFPPAEYVPPRPGRFPSVWWVEELGGYRQLDRVA